MVPRPALRGPDITQAQCRGKQAGYHANIGTPHRSYHMANTPVRAATAGVTQVGQGQSTSAQDLSKMMG